jgi:hypothetical protein
MMMTIVPTGITVMSTTVPTTTGATTMMTIGRVAIGIGGGGGIITTTTMIYYDRPNYRRYYGFPPRADGRPDVIRGVFPPPTR